MPIENEMTVEEFRKEQKRLGREHWNITFAKQLDAEGWFFVREHKFHPIRKWKFDFVISRGFINQTTMFMCATNLPDHLMIKSIAVEIEGGTYKRGRHTRGAGFAGDCEKYNTAVAMGWRVFRFPAEMIKDGSAIKFLREEVWK